MVCFVNKNDSCWGEMSTIKNATHAIFNFVKKHEIQIQKQLFYSAKYKWH